MKKLIVVKILGIGIPLCLLASIIFIKQFEATCMFTPKDWVLASNLLVSKNSHHTIFGECGGKMFVTIVNDNKNPLTVNSARKNKILGLNNSDDFFVQAGDTILLKQDDKISTINIEKFSATDKK